jgi:hypothetical protein
MWKVKIDVDGWGCLFLLCGGMAFYFMVVDILAKNWFAAIIWTVAWIAFAVAGACLGEWRRIHGNSNGSDDRSSTVD